MAIRFFLHQIDLKIGDKKGIQARINKILSEHNKISGDINIILSSDEYILEINKRYLKRNYFTDIITFDYSSDNTINGELFISDDRIKENAGIYKVTYEEELWRVIIHGILHLLGYNDNNDINKQQMRSMEDHYLSDFKG